MRSAMAEVDFESEGLLEGVEGRAREARLKLLRELADEGVPLDELRGRGRGAAAGGDSGRADPER